MKSLVHRLKTKRSSLDKPLPSPPRASHDDDDAVVRRKPMVAEERSRHRPDEAHKPIAAERRVENRPEYAPQPQVAERRNQNRPDEARQPPAAESRNPPPSTHEHKPIVAEERNTRRTEDTTVSTIQAPAVTHETIRRVVHEHEQVYLTREIHNHHIHHRILPVHDVQVLPAVHYVSDENGCREVAAKDLPGRTGNNIERIIEESYKKTLPQKESAAGSGGRRGFSARQFADGEGDYREHVTPEGTQQTERWWVHPPELQSGGHATGQTKAFHFGSPEGGGQGSRN